MSILFVTIAMLAVLALTFADKGTDAAETPAPFDEDGRVADDRPCRRCGYSLLGLEPAARCPECSTPVVRSLGGDRLSDGDPLWVDGLGRGIKWILIGVFASLGIMIAGWIAMGIAGVVAARQNSDLFEPLLLFMSLVAALLSLPALYGVWLLTQPDPGRLDREPPLGARRLARWGMLALVLYPPIEMSVSPGMSFGFTVPQVGAKPVETLLIVLSLVVSLVMFVGIIGTLAHLRSLAQRIPRPRLGRHASIVMWGYGLTWSVMFSAGAVFMLFPSVMSSNAPGPALIVIGLSSCVAGLGMLVFGIWGIVLLFLYHGAFTRAAAVARAAWPEAEG